MSKTNKAEISDIFQKLNFYRFSRGRPTKLF
jgi:hypothetical protein